MNTRRIFVDTEWTAVPWSAKVDLLWVGLTDESGRHWSAVRSDASVEPENSQYVADLMRLLTPDVPRLPRSEMASGVRGFCTGVTEFWAWIPALASFAEWSKLGASAQPVYQQCKDIDLQMLRTLVTPWPPSWPTELRDLNAAACMTGAALPARAPDHLHPRVHSEWNRELFARIQARQGNHDA
jgi:hypothetical protein